MNDPTKNTQPLTVSSEDEEFDRKTFHEVIELIPQIIQKSQTCIERELNADVHNPERMQIEREHFHEAVTLMEGKWTVDVIYMIFLLKTPSYNDILHSLPGINSRTLTDRLRLLEEHKILQRTTHDTRPVRVSYQLTSYGSGLILMLIPTILYLGWPNLIPKP